MPDRVPSLTEIEEAVARMVERYRDHPLFAADDSVDSGMSNPKNRRFEAVFCRKSS